MTEKWNGSLVSIDCGDVLGVYEGIVAKVDTHNQTISLRNVLRNSQKCQVPEVTLRSRDIKNLRIVKSAAAIKASVSAIIGQNRTSAFEQPLSSKKETKVPLSVIEDNMKKKSDVKKKNSMKYTENRIYQSERDEACFNVPINSDVLDTEFDFEKNLALFDKRAVFDEIDAHSKNDTVRLVDCNKRNQQKYRHDENILTSHAPIFRQISVPCMSQREYVTDSGLVVPTVTEEFKELLFKKAEEVGLSTEVRIEMIGRGASEMVLQLLGGNHRLNPQNTHQRPTVIILSGAHIQGAQVINCGRQLANHRVNVTVLCPPLNQKMDKWFTRELGLFSLSGGAKTSDVSRLPSSVDLVVSSLESHSEQILSHSAWTEAAVAWSMQSKSPILCVDPKSNSCLQTQNWILSPVLPFAFADEQASVYVCDIGLPKGIFNKVGVTYASPFGSKFVIPLYTKNI